jgi:hypothetical protein
LEDVVLSYQIFDKFSTGIEVLANFLIIFMGLCIVFYKLFQLPSRGVFFFFFFFSLPSWIYMNQLVEVGIGSVGVGSGIFAHRFIKVG